MNLEQLTMNGFLFSVDSDFFTKELSNETELRVLLDTSVLDQACSKDLTEIRTHLSQYAFNLMYSSRKEDSLIIQRMDIEVQSSFDYLKNKKVYIFFPYSKASSGQGVDVKSVQKFVTHTRDLIRGHFNFHKKSA